MVVVVVSEALSVVESLGSVSRSHASLLGRLQLLLLPGSVVRPLLPLVSTRLRWDTTTSSSYCCWCWCWWGW